MKKLKIIIVSLLAVILCIMCVTTSTFSWFTRPQSNNGDGFSLGFNYEISTGRDVTMRTYASNDDGKTYVETDEINNFSNADGLAAGKRICYRTDLINSGKAAQSVSLYLSKLTMPDGANGSFYLGVNNPLKTYKQYPKITNLGSSGSTTYTKASNNKMRIYFQPKNSTKTEPDVNWKDKNYYVCYGINSYPSTYLALKQINSSGTYYADIPSVATQLFFSVQDWTESYQRTQTFTNIKSDGQSQTQSLVFYLNGTYDSNVNNNAQADKSIVTGAYIANYYSTINIPVGSTFNASLNSSTDYAGNIKYSHDASNSSIFTANETTGEIEAKDVGPSTLYTKVVGQYGDTFEVQTTVNVVAANPDVVDTGSTDIPIVTNVKVGGRSEENKPGVVSVYWFIKNDSESGPLKYSIDDIYLTL